MSQLESIVEQRVVSDSYSNREIHRLQKMFSELPSLEGSVLNTMPPQQYQDFRPNFDRMQEVGHRERQTMLPEYGIPRERFIPMDGGVRYDIHNSTPKTAIFGQWVELPFPIKDNVVPDIDRLARINTYVHHPSPLTPNQSNRGRVGLDLDQYFRHG